MDACRGGCESAACVHVLSYYHGIINDNAYGHDQPEEADHVQRLARGQHDSEGRHEGGRNAGHYPEGDAHLEECDEDQGNEDQATRSVLDQQVDPVLEQVGGCIVSFHDEVRRQGRLDLVQVRFDGLGLQERIGTHCALNAQLDCLPGIPVYGNALFIVRFTHLCDVSKVYLPSVLVGLYFNLSQCPGSRQQPQAPDLALSVAQIARGKVL